MCVVLVSFQPYPFILYDMHNCSTILPLCPLQSYLKRFYNLTEGSRGRNGLLEKQGKVSEMQRFFRLKVTGTLDHETMHMMKKPRCGVPDVAAFSTFQNNLKWPTNQLTYR